MAGTVEALVYVLDARPRANIGGGLGRWKSQAQIISAWWV